MKNRRFSSALALLLLTASPAAGLELEQQATRDLVDLVTRAGELVAKSGVASCTAFKQQGGEWLHDDTYVFVLDMTGKAVCHPGRPGLEGKDLSELRDPDGKQIMKLILRQLERGGRDGWVHYLWPRPGGSVLGWKSTYVRQTEAPDGTARIVGAGVYGLEVEKAFVVDRVTEAVELLTSDGRAAFDVLRDKSGGFQFYDAYVFVMSSDGVMLVNPPSPDLEGKSALDIEDKDGVRPGQAMLELLAQKDHGWVSYFWPRPGDEKPARKEAFVTKVRVGEEELVVGAGVYYD